MDRDVAIVKIRNHRRVCRMFCALCSRYAAEIVQLMDAPEQVPDELASKIRAQACPEGKEILDAIVGAGRRVGL